MRNRRLGLGLGLLVFFGLALLNVRSNHGWGDDFSMYIHQAKNLITGIPQTENGYLYSPATSYVGPRAYPVGFPLLLAPFYAVFGNSIFHFEWLIAISFFALSILTWLYLDFVIGNLALAFAFSLTLVLNPWLINLKGNIVSDIPFAAALMGLIFLLRDGRKLKRWEILFGGVLAGYILLIRTAGFAVFGGFFLFYGITWLKDRTKNNFGSSLGPCLGLSVVGLSFFGLFQYVLFPTPTLGTYVDSMNFYATGKLVLENAEYYLQTVREIIPNAGPRIFQTVLYDFLIVGVICGFFLQLRRRIGFSECFFIAYTGLLLVWPGLQGFRLLLPLAPLALGYAFLALRRGVPAWTEGQGGKIFAALLVLVTAGVFKHPVSGLQETVRITLDGPQLPEAEAAFAFIREHLPKDTAITFWKARALALYGERPSIVDPSNVNEAIARAHFRTMHATHILVDQIWTESCIKDVAKKDGKSIFKNSRFELFAVEYGSKH